MRAPSPWPALTTPVLPALLLSTAALHAQNSWLPSGGGAWGTPGNWTTGVPIAGDNIAIGNTSAATITLDGNRVGTTLALNNTAALTLSANGANRTLILSGGMTVSGSGGVVIGSTNTNQGVSLTATTLTKTGSGTLEIANSSTIGNVFLEGGDTIIRNANALGTTGTITLGAASGTAGASLRGSAVTLAKSIVLGGSSGTLMLYNLGFSTTTYTGGITGTNNLRIDSVISGGSGGTTFSTGAINNAGTLSFVNSGNATLDGVTGTITVNSAIGSNVTAVSLSNNTTATAGITKGAQLTVFGSSANAYTGNTTVNAGATLRLSASNVLPDGAGKGSVAVNGTLDMRGDETVNGLSGSGVITRGATGTSVLTVGSNNASSTFSGALQNGSGTLALTKTGSGTLALSTANSYSGTTSLGNGSGILAISHGQALGTGSVSLTKGGTGLGTLELSNDITVANHFTITSATGFGGGGSAHIRNASGDNTISGNLTLNASGGNGINIESASGMLTLSGNITSTVADNTRQLGLGGAGDGEVTGSIANTGANAFSVIKSGTGTWTISGTATYTGTTNINGGTFRVNTTLSGTSGVTIGAGATLEGIGSISTGTLAFGGAGTLSAGNSIGTLGLNAADLTGGTLRVEFGTGSIDLINVAGLLDLTGSTVDFSQLTGALDGVSPYTFANYGSLSGTFADVLNLPDGYELDYGTGTTSALTLIAVPEPRVALLAGAGLLCNLRRRRMPKR
ncbi:autotransporter-associated beta strand repeat-containing protein [Luteolibacter arcticus]|uniref:Autotransporter-associated beta strand repeat-containing protein n=1 Tax=Luteolibacter arcticus TaxID=1581411 RepID=A0ABT3GC43_9BACT|nr:autotransporter-associated beta strand repeat-containing protein [Luteolibacter arcticus]MCW1921196.1 autotransporter-associated beta strand repeat-containing protein [Luteolibacter arcticus]